MYVVLLNNGEIVAQKTELGNKNHSKILTKATSEVLNDSGIGFEQINIFACDIGPGSFTGIRIGIAALKGYLTVFPDAKTIAFTSLELLNEKTGSSDCLMDAGKDLYYYQKICGTNSAQPVLIDSEKAHDYIKNGAAVFDDKDDFSQSLCSLVSKKIAKKNFVDELTPVYLRKPQAQEERENKIVKEITFLDNEIDDMLEIEKRCFAGEAWNRSDFEFPSKDGLITLGIFEEKKLVAYGMIYLADDEADLCTIGVLPEWRKRGYGNALMTALIEAAKKRNVKKITLEVSKGNENAIKMYSALGFITVGERKNYYKNSNFGNNSAFIMTLDL